MPPTIHKVAQNDTPSSVDVPNTQYGLLMWAVGRFGGGILIALFFVYAWKDSNEQTKDLTKNVLSAYSANATVQAQMVGTLAELTRTLERLSSEAERMHRSEGRTDTRKAPPQ